MFQRSSKVIKKAIKSLTLTLNFSEAQQTAVEQIRDFHKLMLDNHTRSVGCEANHSNEAATKEGLQKALAEDFQKLALSWRQDWEFDMEDVEDVDKQSENYEIDPEDDEMNSSEGHDEQDYKEKSDDNE